MRFVTVDPHSSRVHTLDLYFPEILIIFFANQSVSGKWMVIKMFHQVTPETIFCIYYTSKLYLLLYILYCIANRFNSLANHESNNFSWPPYESNNLSWPPYESNNLSWPSYVHDRTCPLRNVSLPLTIFNACEIRLQNICLSLNDVSFKRIHNFRFIPLRIDCFIFLCSYPFALYHTSVQYLQYLVH